MFLPNFSLLIFWIISVLVAIFPTFPRFDNFDTKFESVGKEISRNYYFARMMRKRDANSVFSKTKLRAESSSSSTIFSFYFSCRVFKMEEVANAKEKSFAWAQVEGARGRAKKRKSW